MSERYYIFIIFRAKQISWKHINASPATFKDIISYPLLDSSSYLSKILRSLPQNTGFDELIHHRLEGKFCHYKGFAIKWKPWYDFKII